MLPLPLMRTHFIIATGARPHRHCEERSRSW